MNRLATLTAVVAFATALAGHARAGTAEVDFSDPQTLPAGLYPALVGAIQSDAPPAYRVTLEEESKAGPGIPGKAYRAENAAQGLAIDFRAGGIDVGAREGASWNLRMRLTGYGYGEDIRPVAGAEPVIDGNRVEYRRGGSADGAALTEWYLNGPLGLDQGFTLATPPGPREPGDDLVLVIALAGGLQPTLSGDGRDIRLQDSAARTVLRYGGLYAFDANKRRLPARLTLADGSVIILIDDRAAVYPVTIDPLLTTETKLTAGDAAAGDRFGNRVAISGDTVVVAALVDDHAGGADAGSVYVFQRAGSTWSEQQKLTASDAAASDAFGASVAISGDTVVVGAPEDDDAGSSSGSAYVFQRSDSFWSQQAKLTAGDAAAGDGFGGSVAISGDTVVIGAYRDDDAGSISGSVYVFQRSGTVWSQQQKLTASDAAAGDEFGLPVVISGDTVVVTAGHNADAGTDSGSAYVFQRTGSVWSEQQKLTASDAAAFDVFGIRIAISGDTVVVGALGDDHAGGNSAGSVYVFQRTDSTWSEQQKLTASDAAAGDRFGESVGISGGTLVVSAPFDDHAGGADAGSAYVFKRSGSVWSEQQKLTASDAAAGDAFGDFVAISGETVVVGASLDDDAGSGSGSVYVYEPEIFDCDGFMPPFDVALTLKEKMQRAIPLKIQLFDSGGFLVNDLDLCVASCFALPPVVNVLFGGTTFGDLPSDDADLLPLGKANEDNIFRFDVDTQEWVYNLGTRLFAAPGMYTVKAVAGDDTYVINGCMGTFERLDD